MSIEEEEFLSLCPVGGRWGEEDSLMYVGTCNSIYFDKKKKSSKGFSLKRRLPSRHTVLLQQQ